ncbi:Adhesion G-protein coupled receptor G6 [Holothuria leucospilota]|uniref:Adhesion G-protein coupled receptor G6 n=1 Tax=Holothuria leucospilota TaxID=206669 RepID=A0A9Q1BAW2_HOLLE|nr:Adhesion G-protein coupled receptor G6 [Holothuria leucospilota]
MGTFAWSQRVVYCVCALVAFFTYEAGSDTSQVCTRPPYSADVLHFVLIDGLGLQLKDTGQYHFTVGSKIIFQCRNAGIAVLDGSSEISCLPSGNWSDDAPYCRDGSKTISVGPADLSRKVDVNGSITIFLPSLKYDFKVQITCQVPLSEDPSLLFSHVRYENNRAFVGQERGDAMYHTEYLILNQPRVNDSGRFSCQDKFTGSSRNLEIRFGVSSSLTSRPTFVLPTSRRTHERLAGGKLTLKCNVTDSLEVWWEHRTWSRVMIVAGTSTLHLDNVTLSDQGSFFCIARGSRGQIAESEAQTLIIPGFSQVLLTIFPNYPAQSIAESFRRAKIDVFSTNETNAGLTFHLRKWLNSENECKDILGEIRGMVREYKENLSYSHPIDFWIQGLSFCIENSDDTAAGTLTFPSTTINSEVESHELCIAVPDVHRGSRKCYGDLVSPATWKDSVVHSCFKTSATDADNRRVTVQQFFKEVGKSEVTSSNASFISRDLADITSTDFIRKEDIGNVTTILEKVTKVNSSSATVTSNVLETIDNIVSTADAVQEAVLTSETSSSLIKSLEHQLENVKMGGSNFSANRANVAVEVVQIENIESSLIFASMEREDYNISETKLTRDPLFLDQERIQASIHIPQPILQLSSNCSSSRKSGEVSLPVTFTVHRSGVLFNDPQAIENNLIQNTWVVSASINCEISNLPIASHISTWFSPKLHQTFQQEGKCVFWDHDLNGNAGGGWSSKGCLDPMVKEPNIYKCSCAHMPKFASFAVLMDLKGSINSKALHILTLIGCVTSIAGLIVTTISYVSIRKFRGSRPKQIILNLCVALLGLYCCFLVGINRTNNQIVCVIFGGLIHFFCLSTVAWMSVEATQLYLLLVKVIGAPVKNFLLKCSLIAWGVYHLQSSPYVLPLQTRIIPMNSVFPGMVQMSSTLAYSDWLLLCWLTIP